MPQGRKIQDGGRMTHFNPEDDRITRIVERSEYGRVFGYRLFTEHYPRGDIFVHKILLQGNHQRGYAKLLKEYLFERERFK